MSDFSYLLPNLEETLETGNTSGGNNAQFVTTDQLQFRSTANFINSPAANEIEITSPRVRIDDGFFVPLPASGQRNWFGRVDITTETNDTGIAFDRNLEGVQFRRDGTAFFSFGLSKGSSGGVLTLPVKTDANRPTAAAGMVIFNATDVNLNIGTPAGWILPDGTAT